MVEQEEHYRTAASQGDVQVKGYLQHNGAPCELDFDLTLTHERWEAVNDAFKMGKV